MVLFTIWLIPEAVAQGMATMIVGRFFNGLAGSAFLAVAAGSIVDMFEPAQIALPMIMFSIAPFLGPAAGPIIGGFINQFTTWWVFLHCNTSKSTSYSTNASLLGDGHSTRY